MTQNLLKYIGNTKINSHKFHINIQTVYHFSSFVFVTYLLNVILDELIKLIVESSNKLFISIL